MFKAKQQESEPVSEPRPSVNRELIARLTMKGTSDEEMELKSIAEATGHTIDEVREEKRRLETESRLDRIERILESQAMKPETQSGTELRSIFDFLRNPGEGLTTLMECLGGAIVIATLIFSIVYGILLLRH